MDKLVTPDNYKGTVVTYIDPSQDDRVTQFFQNPVDAISFMEDLYSKKSMGYMITSISTVFDDTVKKVKDTSNMTVIVKLANCHGVISTLNWAKYAIDHKADSLENGQSAKNPLSVCVEVWKCDEEFNLSRKMV